MLIAAIAPLVRAVRAVTDVVGDFTGVMTHV
jgi:hypothetical protein